MLSTFFFSFSSPKKLFSVKIQDIQSFSDHLVVHEREDGLPKITVYRLPDAGKPLQMLQGGRAVDFIDPIYSLDPSESQFSSSILRFKYSSLKTPPSVYDYDMNSGISVLKKIEPVCCTICQEVSCDLFTDLVLLSHDCYCCLPTLFHVFVDLIIILFAGGLNY